jgi:1-acyl-sn-glycerol-3-phosphate acyltransferase
MPDEPIPPARLVKMAVLSLFGWVTVIVTTIFFGTLAVFTPWFDKTGNLGHAVCARWWARSILAMVGVRVRVSGLEHLDPKQAYVVTANHLSNFDILAILAWLPLQFRWIAKKEVFKVPFMGWGMTRVGYVKIDREKPEQAWAHLFEAESKLKKGISLMFFPEGTRSPDGEIKRFKSGAFVLSVRTGVPVLPLTVVGTREIMRKRSLLFDPGTVDLVIQPPIRPDAFSLESKYEFAQVVRNQIAVQLEKSREERQARAGKRP